MKRKQPKSRAAVLKILAVTNKTATQFAEDIGAEAGEVRQWTTVRDVPVEYRKRIKAFFGVEWDASGLRQAGGGRRRPFTWKSFEDWRKRLVSMHQNRLGFPTLPANFLAVKPLPVKPNGERYDQYNIESFLIARALDAVGRTLNAAEDRGGTNNPRRLFAVIESLFHWQQRIVEDFKLSNSKKIQDAYVQNPLGKDGRLGVIRREKYIRLMKSVTDEPSGRQWRYKTDKSGSNVVIENGKRAFEEILVQ